MNTVDPGRGEDAQSVLQALEAAARRTVPALLIHKIRASANSKLIRAINLGFSLDTLTVAHDLHEAISRSMGRMQTEVGGALSETSLLLEEQNLRREIEQSFADGSWIKRLPGREILKQFVSASNMTVGYEVLRNLVVGRMAELGIKPEGMKHVVNKVVAD
jgi:hypothetical protein